MGFVLKTVIQGECLGSPAEDVLEATLVPHLSVCLVNSFRHPPPHLFFLLLRLALAELPATPFRSEVC